MKRLFLFLAALAACLTAWGQTSQVSGVVRDASGLSIPGAEIKITQTNTGLVRTASTGSDGSYILPNLPVGPYQLTVTKEGFGSYVQNGIILQVDTNPAINATLQVGSVVEQVEVEAQAAMVETHTTGVGQVIDQQRVVDLPLNGRQATDLIVLSGAATPVASSGLNTSKNYPTATISIAGGQLNGISFSLDGASHNDPFNSLSLPYPFPDALQEFKVETSAVPARYGQHASGSVNVITKSGTNEIHGDLFEFVRNYQFNARSFFAPARDTLKRNQFGGTIGGPILKNKLFFFAGYQGTTVRSDPPGTINSVPTQAMLAGDFTAYASPACNNGQQITLKAPFVNNQISPTLLNGAALKFAKRLPATTDPCGKVQYGMVANNREHQILGRVDYSINTKHMFFGRYFIGNYKKPMVTDPANILTFNTTGVSSQTQSFVIGHNYTINPTTIAAFRATVNRTRNLRVLPEHISPTDLGVQVYAPLPGYIALAVGSGTGGFSLGSGTNNRGYFNGTSYQFGGDVDLIRGAHQIAFGMNFIHAGMNVFYTTRVNGDYRFNGQVTGLALADFLTGNANQYFQNNPIAVNERSDFIGAYIQDSWRISQTLSLNYGVRWEPYLPQRNVNSYVMHFDPAAFAAGTKSTVYANAPAGLSFNGDPGFPGNSDNFKKMGNFGPRLGVVWDPKGDGRMSVRAAYGLFYDTPNLFFNDRFTNNPPWGQQIQLAATNFTTPWAVYPGGNPFPAISTLSKTVPFPLAGLYVNYPLHVKNSNVQQWNFSLQRQVGAGLLLSASYFGNKTTHLWTATELNPAQPVAGATLGNVNQRRRFYLQNQSQGQYYSSISQLDDGGNANYNALLVSAQRRMLNNFSVLANFTWSHCISDPGITELITASYVNPSNRAADRGNCGPDRRRIVNLSLIATSPKFSNRALRLVAGGWQLSTILRYESGNFSTVTTGVDNALIGTSQDAPQRPNLVLADPFASRGPGSQTFSIQYLNRAAFSTTALGSGILGNLGRTNILNPGSVQVDMGLSRYFQIREGHKLEFRWEAFNVPNRLNAGAPSTALNSGTFGQITSGGSPRIMQFALKYTF